MNRHGERYQRLSMIIGPTLFALLFLILENSRLAGHMKIELIFRSIYIPVYQWSLVLLYVLFLRFTGKRPWQTAVSCGIILGLVFNLYAAMLNTAWQVWSGINISPLYVKYINIYVFIATMLLAVWSGYLAAGILAGKIGGLSLLASPDLLPISILFVYAVSSYAVYGYYKESAILTAAPILAFYTSRRIGPESNAIGSAVNFFKWLARERNILIFIFVLALAARLLFLSNLLHIEGDRYPYASDDGDAYNAYGLKGVTDPAVFLRESPHHWQLFYAAFLSLVYKICGHSYAAAGAVQSVIWALTCSLCFILAKRITSSTTASLLASLGVALDSNLIFLAATLNTEALYIPLLVIMTLFLLYYRESEKGGRSLSFLVLAGITLGAAAIIRALGIVLITVALPWIMIWGRAYEKKVFLKRVRDSMIFFAMAILTIAPITVINYLNTGEFYLVYRTGSQLWACGSSSWGEGMVPSNKKLIELGMTDPVKDPIGSVKALLAHPKEALIAYSRIIPKRVRNLFLWPNFGAFDPVFLLNSSQRPNRYASTLEFYSILLLFASPFVFIFSRIKPYLKSLTLMVIVFYLTFHGIFFLSIGPRYGAPTRPFLYIIMAFGAYKISSWILSSLGATDRMRYEDTADKS